MKPIQLENYFEEQNWNWGEYFKFAFVRNPWASCVSKWEYRKRIMNNPTKRQKENGFHDKSKNAIRSWKSFEGMIRQGLAGISTSPQYLWVFGKDSEQLVDFVGKCENLQEDFNIICDKIGIPRQQLPHANKTKHKHYTEYYNDETRQIVAEKYAKDIEYFGYAFGE